MRPIIRPTAFLWLLVGIILLPRPAARPSLGERARPASRTHRSLTAQAAAKHRRLAQFPPVSLPSILPIRINPEPKKAPQLHPHWMGKGSWREDEGRHDTRIESPPDVPGFAGATRLMRC